MLAEVYGAGPPSARYLRQQFALGRERTIEQDPAFAMRILVDIAIKALSPAINDPTTAVQVLDHVEALLGDLARTEAARALRDRLSHRRHEAGGTWPHLGGLPPAGRHRDP